MCSNLTISKRIINEHNELTPILEGIMDGLSSSLVKLITKTYEKPFLTSIITSQLDADRIDYLLRDVHMTGAKYGQFDLNWLLKNLEIGKPSQTVTVSGQEYVLAINKAKGLNVLEQYILGRFYMYKNVYLHHSVRSFEAIVKNIIRRAVTLNDEKLEGLDFFLKLRNNEISVEEYVAVDDQRGVV